MRLHSAAVVAALVLSLTACLPFHKDDAAQPQDTASTTPNQPKSLIGTPEYTGNPERSEYQRQLNNSPTKFRPEYDIVEYDNELWMNLKPAFGDCAQRCGAVIKTSSGYKVTLPVGFRHGHNVTPMPKNLVPVKTLVYWDEKTHRSTTVTNRTGGGVQLPYRLRREQNAPFMQKGQTGYIEAVYVLKDKHTNKYFLSPRAVIRYEPMGPEFGHSPDALITRRSDGLGWEVKLPEHYSVTRMDADYALPVVVVTFANGPLFQSPGNTKMV